MISTKISPHLAFTILCHELLAAEERVMSRAQSLTQTGERVESQLITGRTSNSLGEVQNNGNMLDAAIGVMEGTRSALLLMARTFMTDDSKTFDLSDFSYEQTVEITDAVDRSQWLAMNLGPFLPWPYTWGKS